MHSDDTPSRLTNPGIPLRTPPTFQIYVLPNPIQPEFLTITVRASESLQAKPTISFEEKSVQISLGPTQVAGTSVKNTWTSVHVLPKDFSGDIEIRVKGEAEQSPLIGTVDHAVGDVEERGGDQLRRLGREIDDADPPGLLDDEQTALVARRGGHE